MEDVIVEKNIAYTLSRLYTNEHVKAHEDMLDRIKEDVETIPEVADDLEEYEKVVERVKLIFRHSPKSPETVHIAGLDSRRDTLWSLDKRLIKSCLGNPDPAVRAAAEDLLNLIETYGNVSNFTLYGETSSITHAITDLKKAENQAKVALIPGLSAYIDELEAVNNELNMLYNKRLDEAEEIKELGKLADYLPLVDKQLVALFHALNIVYGYNERTTKLPALKATIERIAKKAKALLDQLKKNLEHRHIKTGKQDPDITNPEVPGEGGDGEEGGDGGDGGGEGGDGGDIQEPDIENPPPFGE